MVMEGLGNISDNFVMNDKIVRHDALCYLVIIRILSKYGLLQLDIKFVFSDLLIWHMCTLLYCIIVIRDTWRVFLCYYYTSPLNPIYSIFRCLHWYGILVLLCLFIVLLYSNYEMLKASNSSLRVVALTQKASYSNYGILVLLCFFMVIHVWYYLFMVFCFVILSIWC